MVVRPSWSSATLRLSASGETTGSKYNRIGRAGLRVTSTACLVSSGRSTPTIGAPIGSRHGSDPGANTCITRRSTIERRHERATRGRIEPKLGNQSGRRWAVLSCVYARVRRGKATSISKRANRGNHSPRLDAVLRQTFALYLGYLDPTAILRCEGLPIGKERYARERGCNGYVQYFSEPFSAAINHLPNSYMWWSGRSTVSVES